MKKLRNTLPTIERPMGGGILSRKNPKGLQRFNKNKKQKRIVIGSIVGILFIIGGISLYRSFAMYKVEKTFDVLQGTVPNFRKTYTEALLNGADPVLDKEGELVPVKIGNNGEVTKADITQPWYSYAKKEWANAVILTEEGKKKNFADNAKIEDQYIESYFVWIPKYSYKIQTLGTSTTPKAFDIEFGLKDTKDDESNASHKECTTPMNNERTQGLSGESGDCEVGEWMTHPSFISFDVNGLWVGKFETSNNNSKVQIKPNQYSWEYMNVATMFQLGYEYQRNLDSHMMKNTEWGAVAYLTQSIYGKCTSNTACSAVTMNSNPNYITGYNTNQAYPKSQSASTTGNNTGIFDMSGGSYEYVMGVVFSSNTEKAIFLQSEFTEEIFNKINTKYYDKYNYNTSYSDYSKRILGDATAETLGWYNGAGNFVATDSSWFRRGGGYDYKYAGVFAFNNFYGNARANNALRIVLAIK